MSWVTAHGEHLFQNQVKTNSSSFLSAASFCHSSSFQALKCTFPYQNQEADVAAFDTRRAFFFCQAVSEGSKNHGIPAQEITAETIQWLLDASKLSVEFSPCFEEAHTQCAAEKVRQGHRGWKERNQSLAPGWEEGNFEGITVRTIKELQETAFFGRRQCKNSLQHSSGTGAAHRG